MPDRVGQCEAITQTSLIGVHRCGCITAALVERYATPKDVRDFYRDSADTGREVRRVDVETVRKDPNFLPSECPHDPKGWERTVPQEPDPIRYKRVPSRNVSVVNVRVPRWPTGFRGGEVGKRDGSWWATEGWLDSDQATATDGSSPRGPAEVLGPFTKQREAAEALIPLAQARSAALAARWDAERKAKATA